MQDFLKSSINKRKEEMHDFYYRGYGDRIKRKRKSMNLTQEVIAKGICSNTYLSKIENNKIAANKDHLLYIMERVGLPTENIGLPEEMILVLQKSIRYFFHKDIESYKKLIVDMEKYEFGILIFIARLGYYILINNIKESRTIYNDMFRYLNALEDFGFSTFMIYGCYYNVLINDYQTARMMIETIQDQIQNGEMLYSLYANVRFIVYGQLHFFNKSRDALNIAQSIFQNQSNFNRLNEIATYKEIFFQYESCQSELEWKQERYELVDLYKRNYLVCLKALNSDYPLKDLKFLVKNQPDYLKGLFLKALFLYRSNDLEQYRASKRELNELNYLDKTELDYSNLIKLYEDNELLYIKDYLINYALPYFIGKQDIFLIKHITDEIVNILIEKKRYKDACSYMKKYEDLKHRLQFKKRIEI